MPLQLQRVHPPPRLDQRRLHAGGLQAGPAHLLHGPADDRYVLRAELALPEGASGLGQAFELAGCAELGVGGVGGEVEGVLQPPARGGAGLGSQLVAAVDLGQTAGADRLGGPRQ